MALRNTSPVVLAILLLSASAHAGGQYVNDNPSQGQQRAGAFTAKASDASALYFNPGALTKLVGKQFTFGLSLVQYLVDYDRTGDYPAQNLDPEPNYVGAEFPEVSQTAGPQPVPLFAFSQRWGRWGFAQGLFTPHGYPKRDFPEVVRAGTGVAAPAPQRYDMIEQTSAVILPSLAVAYDLGAGVSLGVRGSWGFATLSSVRATWGLENQREKPGTDSKFRLSAKDYFIPTWGAGLSWVASSNVEVGLNYSAPVNIRAKGEGDAELGADLAGLTPGGLQPAMDPKCEAGGTPGALKVCVDLDLAQWASAGVRYVFRGAKGEETGDVELDVRWENWSSARDYVVRVDGRSALGDLNVTNVRHGFDDVISVRLGGSKRWAVEKDSNMELRAGMAHDTAAAPLSWTRLDVDGAARTFFAAGVAYEWGSTRVDIGGGYVYQTGRQVVDVQIANPDVVSSRVQPDPTVASLAPDAQPYKPINAGSYSSGYFLGSAGVTVAW